MSLALAVDVGGTKVEACLVDEHGSIVPGSRTRAATGATAAADAEAARRAFQDVVRRCVASAPDGVSRAGIGSAGPIDLAAGTISPINLPAVRDFPIVDVVAEAACLDIALRLDGTCIALAELWLGAARGVSDAIVIVVSTGVGGGVISGGRLVSGASGNAGHLGQLVVDRIGDEGAAAATVEGIGSGTHTVAWARAQGWAGASGEELAAALGAGDPIAAAAVARSARAVGTGLSAAATLLDLELAVIGGGFAAVSDDYVDRVQAIVRGVSVNAYAGRMRVVRARLGADAPLIGAGALVHRPDLLA